MHFSSNIDTAIGEKPTGLEALFSPLAGATEAPAKADSSLSPEVNGKIKDRVFNVAIEGRFEQTESIIRDIERLQPLLIVRDYQSTLAPTSTADEKGQVGSAIINTSFQLQALMPVNKRQGAGGREQGENPIPEDRGLKQGRLVPRCKQSRHKLIYLFHG